MLNEIDKDELFFQAITRQGRTIDSRRDRASAETQTRPTHRVTTLNRRDSQRPAEN